MLEEIHQRNRAFYDSVWRRARVRDPRWFGTWAAVEELTSGCSRLLEVGPGVRPRFPADRTVYADISREAAVKLRKAGGSVVLAGAGSLPFADGSFDAAAAVDVVEHADDPAAAIGEIARVLRPGGRLLLAIPVHGAHWTSFDGIVGHKARFEPNDLLRLLEERGLRVARSAGFGILPRSRFLVHIGAWVLERIRGPAAWFEDRVVLPAARIFERPTRWAAGFRCDPACDGLILCCKKIRTAT